jgi:putative glutamine amidotransferase
VKLPLKVTARATDGVIEGVEFSDHKFRVGVQWHPERMPESEPTQRLWKAFIAACT